MTRFKRLTWNDLDNHSRDELLPRLEAEQHYWTRKEKRGLSETDQQARKQFNEILLAVIKPAELGNAITQTAAWLKGERSTNSSYWTDTPAVNGTDRSR